MIEETTTTEGNPVEQPVEDNTVLGSTVSDNQDWRSNLPEDLKNAFLAAEDDGFFEHRGVSYPSLIRAFSQYIRVGLDATGGGTITMQVVRNYLLTREKKVRRKIKEIFLAFHLESSFSKKEIFEI